MTTEDRFPHPLALLTVCILLAAVLTWVLSAGEFQRVDDPETGRTVVVAGTYTAVEPAPLYLLLVAVGAVAILIAIGIGLQ